MRSFGEEAKTEESSCGGTWAIGRLGAERAQEARQPGKRAQGRLGQKPQEENRRQAQGATSTSRTPEKLIEIVIASICSRFGDSAIGRGASGIRFVGGR
jgi:hypothetical protein